MLVKEIKKQHDFHKKNVDNWRYYSLAYDGGKEFIKNAIGERHERESAQNYARRVNNGINFNYCTSIIDLFSFYLREKPPIRDLGKLKLENDKQWALFLRDCDFNGMDYDEFMDESEKNASISGTIGILVNKPFGYFRNIGDEIKNRVYPYLAAYAPENIRYWRYETSKKTGKPMLAELILAEACDIENVERFTVWTQDMWATFDVKKDADENDDIAPVRSGRNPLGEIPMVWFPNIRSIQNNTHGRSDLVEISLIVASIVRNLSCADEIVDFAGFPMLSVPMEEDRGDTDDGDREIPIGKDAVHEHNPEYGEGGKASWIEPEIASSIDAILKLTERKADEIHRIANLTGAHAQRKGGEEAVSGLALRYEYQQLVSVLSKKAESQNEAERQVIYYWGLWQNKRFSPEDIDVRRQRDFSVDSMAIELDNIIKSMRYVMSDKFKILSQQKIAKNVLPDASESDRQEINGEIEKDGPKVEFEDEIRRNGDSRVSRKPKDKIAA